MNNSLLLLDTLVQNPMTDSLLLFVQAAPAAAEKKANGAAAAAVQAVQEEATPSRDVYGHLPEPEENNKVCPVSYQGTCKREGGGLSTNGERGEAFNEWGRALNRSCLSAVVAHACKPS